MKGRKPFVTRMRIAFASAAAVFGLGLASGGLDSLPKDPATDTQSVTTYNQGTSQAYGYNISPFDQLWKATLGMKDQTELSEEALTAARKGDTWRTQALLENGLTVYMPGAHDAFAAAAFHGHADVFDAYIQAKIDPGANDGKALVEAVRGGNRALAYRLIDNGVSGASQGSEGLTFAAIKGDVDMINALLQAGADPKAQGSSALKNALTLGNEAVVMALIEAGADVGADNHAAVRIAAEKGNLELLKFVVAKGGDVSADNGAALIAAAGYPEPQPLQFILDQKSSYTAAYSFPYPFFSLRFSDYRTDFWDQHSLDFNDAPSFPTIITVRTVSPDVQDGAPLSRAVVENRLENARLLLEAGASPNAGKGIALSSAVFGGHEEMVRLLLSKGADVNAGDGSALFMAVITGNSAMARLLIANEADPDLRNGEIKKAAEASENKELQTILKISLAQKPLVAPTGPPAPGL